MFSEVILALWTLAGLAWWGIAWRLVRKDQLTRAEVPPVAERRSLTVFKPLPRLDAKGLETFAEGITSFMAQLDADSEMLLGVHESDRATVAPFVDKLMKKYPDAALKLVYRTEPDRVANPKISWQRYLAPHADGELWLWSDADIVAPDGFLRSARDEFERGGAALMTFPYIVRRYPTPASLLEALFVNVEFYPGILLLRKSGPVDFGLGAAMLFRRDDFLRRVEWSEIGAWLADDFFLGQKLGPVRIGNTTLVTVPASSKWSEALKHDLRWARTIRWNRPFGAFSRILVMPVVGWLAAVAFHPASFFAWAGLLGMVQAEVLAAALICRRTGCRLDRGNIAALEMWSFWRIVLWFLSWMPAPVVWSGRTWRRPQAELNREIDLRTT